MQSYRILNQLKTPRYALCTMLGFRSYDVKMFLGIKNNSIYEELMDTHEPFMPEDFHLSYLLDIPVAFITYLYTRGKERDDYWSHHLDTLLFDWCARHDVSFENLLVASRNVEAPRLSEEDVELKRKIMEQREEYERHMLEKDKTTNRELANASH